MGNYYSADSFKDSNYTVDFSRQRISEMHYSIMRVWEREYSESLREIFDSSDIKSFLDLGANTGCVIEHLDKFLDKKASIIAFEPIDENFNFLDETVQRIGRSDKSRLYKKAVFYGAEKARAFGVGDNSTAGLFLEGTLPDIDESDHRKPVLTTHTFECTTLEDAIGDIDSIDLCKIDVEGSEYNIIKNSTFIKERVNNIILEYHWKSQNEIFEWLSENLPTHHIVKLFYDRDYSLNECSMIWLRKN
jgi:FkbM family methyltransferase